MESSEAYMSENGDALSNIICYIYNIIKSSEISSQIASRIL